MSKLVVGGRQRGASEKETSLLEEWLGARARLVETPLPRGGAELLLPHSTTQQEGCALAFVASKVHDDGMEPWGGKRKCLRMTYAVTEGPGFPPISLQDELEKLADWRALPSPRKVATRLELLHSPAPLTPIPNPDPNPNPNPNPTGSIAARAAAEPGAAGARLPAAPLRLRDRRRAPERGGRRLRLHTRGAAGEAAGGERRAQPRP